MATPAQGSASVARLGPRLLARKGGARPAMRADKDNSLAGLAASQAQLGWDDMGPCDTNTAEIAPVGNNRPASALSSAKGRRAAFTLRLDAERHFKLRLASTLQDCSAQKLVTEALDRLLDDIPHLNELAAHVGQSRNQA